MLPADEIHALTYAIDRLDTELMWTLADDRRKSISDTLSVLREMRTAIEGDIA